MDGQNRYVTDLEQEDFAVFEDGVKQEVTFFNRRQQPIALSMLLDSSASMEDKLETLQAAAANFVRRLKPGDLGQIIDFDSRVEVKQEFTSNHNELEQAIRRNVYGTVSPGDDQVRWMAAYLRTIRAAMTRAPFQSICDGSALRGLPEPAPENADVVAGGV